jgi:hypothetical protein
MLLNHDPVATSFFENAGPAGVRPVCRLALPLVDIVGVAKEPGDTPRFRQLDAELSDLLSGCFEIGTFPNLLLLAIRYECA